MTVLQSLLLGVLQGVAEFLPISSSGHLTVAERLLGIQGLPPVFNVFLHLATLCAVVIFFRRRIWQLLCAVVRLVARKEPPQSVTLPDGTKQPLATEEAARHEANLRAYVLAILITTAITGAIGLCTEKLLGDLPLRFVFMGFLLTAALLVLSALVPYLRGRRGNGQDTQGSSQCPGGTAPTPAQAAVIGAMQGLGTLPGISRSGSTIAGAAFCGVERGMAGEYSFIASIPAVLGAFLLELKDIGSLGGVGAAPLAVGFAAAFVSGYAALGLLMRLIKRGKLQWFACYLVPAAILGLVLL